jgi:hypothetical protein
VSNAYFKALEGYTCEKTILKFGINSKGGGYGLERAGYTPEFLNFETVKKMVMKS